MLAKDVKIKTIARQAGLIKKQLRIINAIDGRDPQYIYRGHVYPEVKDEIKQQDENVSIHFEMRKGIPVTFFTLLNEQREFIEDKLAERAEAEDGNPMYVYPGYVPNEILEYFKSEGYILLFVRNALMGISRLYSFSPMMKGCLLPLRNVSCLLSLISMMIATTMKKSKKSKGLLSG